MRARLSQKRIKEIREAFAIFDKDGDGTISSQELCYVMRSLGMDPTERDLARCGLTKRWQNNMDNVVISVASFSSSRLKFANGISRCYTNNFNTWELNCVFFPIFLFSPG